MGGSWANPGRFSRTNGTLSWPSVQWLHEEAQRRPGQGAGSHLLGLCARIILLERTSGRGYIRVVGLQSVCGGLQQAGSHRGIRLQDKGPLRGPGRAEGPEKQLRR